MIDKELQESLAGMDTGLLKTSINQFNRSQAPDESPVASPRPKYPVLVPGKYIGHVALTVTKVKKGDNIGRAKITFEMTAAKGELKGGKTWHHRVIKPSFLDGATDEECEQHTIGILKLLRYCGVVAESDDTWEKLVVKVLNIGTHTNMIRFTVKKNPSKPEELSPYIDGAYWEDEENSLFNAPIGAGESLPNGSDFPV